MSVQSEFFEALLTELKARGLSDEVAEENVSKFKSQLSERAENEDYINDALSKIPPASIAENIYNMLRAETDEDALKSEEVEKAFAKLTAKVAGATGAQVRG